MDTVSLIITNMAWCVKHDVWTTHWFYDYGKTFSHDLQNDLNENTRAGPNYIPVTILVTFQGDIVV